MKPLRLLAPATGAATALALAGTLSLTASAQPAPHTSTAGTLSLSAQAAPQAVPTAGLDILLTNDDGWSAPGINAVYDALVAAGHNVTMVAPASNQSGVSTKIDFAGTLTATNPVPDDPNIWSVTTTPAGSVLFGLNEVLADDLPDLVISGTNVGENIGFGTNFSGTVGAATVASGMYDIPSIAVSTEVVRGEDATMAYTQTADLLVDLISGGLPVLPRGQFLNINHPWVDQEHVAPLGVRYVDLADLSPAVFGFGQSETDPTQWAIEMDPSRADRAPAGTDSADLRAGYITMTVMDADRGLDVDEVPGVAGLVRDLNGDPHPPSRPRR
ncbi:5'/3'-nucleotidase SurE [Nocardioides alcanivorans]|uniref:5'/3'-nucleotidase SurE n=1 Tax=Nocardioides alcanivorans TaxID=2897352 RepID=UPI001F336041|nr:5'/3'-nucleotidase SurE [Nocardioides alcanivorans]